MRRAGTWEKKATPPSVKARAGRRGPVPRSKAKATPAEAICDRAKPTKTTRFNRTYTPMKEHIKATRIPAIRAF